MADNTTITAQAGGDTVRDKDRSGVKTQIVGRDLNIGGATEVLETAGALADGVANPTVPGYGSYGFVWNGTTWDRVVGTAATGTRVAIHPAASFTLGTASTNVGAPVYVTGTGTAASTSLVAAPAAGLSIYVTDMEGSNEGTTGTAIALQEGVGGATRYRRFLAASGGGFVSNLKTPWKLPAATALAYLVSAATTWNLTVNFYVAN